ncbi:MAG: type I-F CRISPR-associated helicase Cas3f [Acinetobacter populi]|jgi:CRISPR-associated endonuclease/helicase Cas3|uniref:type I-F CRISPR-associated helicase Cas3f n=1 Tax=Acinetobacter populi TaxID=1582270 RepID=UPI00235296E2|nr:type I-F CRISPR-associated helicase Cas3f [Acinetobacter populi]MCH4247221.1 type I-F CRISPR-associated helicase Cas3f [Acinetobacter populi]
MHVIFISACEKRAIKKTRAILDSYAIRTGPSSWQAPMTMEALGEIRRALKKVATRQTAVAAYINYGMRRMKLYWVVGAKHKFASNGAYPVASTGKQQKMLMLDNWVRASSLLAGAAGDMHDIGKASQHFQQKLSPEMAGKRIKDQVRHEWLSMKLLQQLRHNGWNWQAAWQNITQNLNTFTLGDRKEIEQGIQNELEAVDYLIVTHHGLLGSAEPKNPMGLPNQENHVRQERPDQAQVTCAGDLPETIFRSHQKRLQRLQALLPQGKDQLLYWKAQALHSRAALIHADHIISAQQFSDHKPDNVELFANTKLKEDVKGFKQKTQDQPLVWHLQQVGDRAAYIAVKMMTDLNLSGLSEQTVDYICQPTTHTRFQWQNIAANALQKQIQKTPELPALILNIAGTGSGKTRMNLRAACTLHPDDPRISIALNLRSLTLQTGAALKSSMNLSDDELAVIIGDTVTQDLFNAAQVDYIDEDENRPEPIFDAIGEDYNLPEWLNPLFTKEVKGRKVNDDKARTVLASPLLVSTIDYLIAAGEPQQQGHHVKALLRIISSDLILDEIDGYEPKALIAVLRLVQLAAMYGRNVICSSATLSLTIAKTIHRAFESGIQMRAALYGTTQKSLIAIIDNELKPQVWLDQSDQTSTFKTKYQQHLDALQQHLSNKPTYRLAQLLSIDEASVLNWKNAVLNAAQQLHQDQAWTFQNTEKRISLGLIRVANIKHAIALSQYLAEHCCNTHIACYHANDWLISRFYKEQRLDQLLTRHKDGKKRKTGNEHIEQDQEIIEIVKRSPQSDIAFIVVATPVEEVGRDHDFDWAIIDASSVQSIVQTAGRVNRHRLAKIQQANIMIPQWNYRYCAMQDHAKEKQQGRVRQVVFTQPGYEGYCSSGQTQTYANQNLAELLPWDQQQQLVINARLRFDQENCLFAKFDDQQIKNFCQNYFDEQGDQLFSRADVDACIMTEQIYKNTPLREAQYQEIYRFEWEDQLNVYKQAYMVDEEKSTLNYTRYHWDWKKDKFTEITAQARAWLTLHPTQMLELCENYNIKSDQGCRISLNVYNSNETKYWKYDLGFGVF